MSCSHYLNRPGEAGTYRAVFTESVVKVSHLESNAVDCLWLSDMSACEVDGSPSSQVQDL